MMVIIYTIQYFFHVSCIISMYFIHVFISCPFLGFQVFDYYLPGTKQIKMAVSEYGEHCLQHIWGFWDQIYELFYNDTAWQTVSKQIDAISHASTLSNVCTYSSAGILRYKTKACRDFSKCTGADYQLLGYLQSSSSDTFLTSPA